MVETNFRVVKKVETNIKWIHLNLFIEIPTVGSVLFVRMVCYIVGISESPFFEEIRPGAC